MAKRQEKPKSALDLNDSDDFGPDLIDEEENEKNFMCEICDQAFIETVESSCGHKFCAYCLYMWKKYDTYCPICQIDTGKIILRHDIDEIIREFFSAANPLAQIERKSILDTRQKANKIPDLAKVLFRNRNPQSFSAIKGIEDTHGRVRVRVRSSNSKQIFQRRQTHGSFFSSAKVDQIIKLNKETLKIEKELKQTYDRIIKMGENINDEEDALAPQFFDQNPASGPLASKNLRPSTVICGLGTSKLRPRLQDRAEVEDLLEQTTEMIKIEKFLTKYSFHNIKVMDEDDLMQGSIYPESQDDTHMEPLREIDYSNVIPDAAGDRLKSGLILQKPNAIDSLKIHPAVQDYLRTKRIRTKIIPQVPLPRAEIEVGQDDTQIINGNEISINNENFVPKIIESSLDESLSDLHRCRESLLKIRDRYNNSAVPVTPVPVVKSGSNTIDRYKNNSPKATPVFPSVQSFRCTTTTTATMAGCATPKFGNNQNQNKNLKVNMEVAAKTGKVSLLIPENKSITEKVAKPKFSGTVEMVKRTSKASTSARPMFSKSPQRKI